MTGTASRAAHCTASLLAAAILLGGTFCGCSTAIAGAAAPPAAPVDPAPDPARGRLIAVPQPGAVRVPLDAAALVMGGDGRGLALADPAGRRVAARVVGLATGEVEARIAALDETPGGWALRLDLGPDPVRHTRLVLELAQPGAARIVLEAGDDGTGFARLAEGTLFRVGDAAGMARSSLDYAPSDARYLRLQWPRAAGLPQLSRAFVVAAADESRIAIATRVVELDPASGSGWLASLPAGGLGVDQLEIAFPGRLRPALRVLAAVEGRWDVVGALPGSTAGSAAVSATGPAAGRAAAPVAAERDVLRLPLAVEAQGASAFRLLADDGGGPAPVVTALAPRRWLRFDARAAATYRIVGGGDIPSGVAAAGAGRGPAEAAEPGAAAGVAALEPVVEASLGEEVAVSPAALSTVARTAVAVQLPRYWRSWEIAVPAGTAAGDVVSLPLPAALFDEPGVGPTSLRPIVGKTVVPFVIDRGTLPMRLAAPVVPGEVRREGANLDLELPLPSGASQLVQLELERRGEAVLEASLRVEARVEERPGVSREHVLGSTVWTCAAGPAPCPALVVLRDVPPRADRLRLRISIRDGDLGTITAARFWTRPTAIRFAWPETQPVALAWGFEPIPEANPQVVAIGRELRARRAVVATLDMARTREEGQALERNMKLALSAAIGVASISLLIVLARSLRRRPE